MFYIDFKAINFLAYVFELSGNLVSWFKQFNISGLNSWISQLILGFKLAFFLQFTSCLCAEIVSGLKSLLALVIGSCYVFGFTVFVAKSVNACDVS